jgi:hypothetical protein
MDPKERGEILNDVARKMGAGGAGISTANWLRFVDAQNDGYQTGPAIGALIPAFELPDQNGVTRTLSNLTGTNGLLLVFSRSAAW